MGPDRGLDLRTFWVRRARRLLPAVVLLVGVVVVTTAAVDPTALATRTRESLAALFYVANWTTIASDVSYFERFAGPGPLDHLWSLAVEEQFYLLWPLMLLGLLKAFRGRVRRVAAATLAIAAASFLLMTVLAVPGFDSTRVHEGTDTRAGGLLVGAAVAMVWRPDRLTDRISPAARNVVDGIGVASLLVVVGLMVFADPFSQMLYDGGAAPAQRRDGPCWSRSSSTRRRGSGGHSGPRPWCGSARGPTASARGTSPSSP